MDFGEVAARMAHCVRFFDPKTKTFPDEIMGYVLDFGRDCRKLQIFREQEEKGRARYAGMSAGEIFGQIENWILIAPDWESRLKMVVCTMPFVADALRNEPVGRLG